MCNFAALNNNTRMRIRGLIMLVVWLLPFSAAVAQWGKNASLEVTDEGNGVLSVRFEQGFSWGEFAGDRYTTIQVLGMTLNNGEVGQPALPTLSRIITLPRGSRLTLGNIEQQEELNERIIGEWWPLAPVTAARVKDGDEPGYHPDPKTYNTDAFYRGGEPLEVKHIGTMGNREVYRITVRPIAYNPVQRSLMESKTLRATLEVKGHPLLEAYNTLPERYLIVSRQQFREGLQPFVRWKQQEGYEVEEIYADTNKRDIVKALIESRWESADGRWPKYLLLVGDVAQLQSFLGTSHPSELNNHITDLYYAEHTGDYLPDALIGRWPVNDTAELRTVVEKTLRYEQCRDLDTNMLKRALLVAGRENSNPAPTTSNGQVNYVRQRLAATHRDIDTLCFHNPASGDQRDAILDDIAQGNSFINYTAHCGTGGWSNPAVSFASIDTLDCTQPLLYVNNCCLSNSFDGTCFGELLLRKPVGGAIGVIGATNSTLWNEDYYWAVGPKYPFSLEPAYDSLHPGAFDLWLGGDVATQGALLAAGNLAVTAFGSPYDKFYWEIYNLLGDPSLRPWLGVPQEMYFWVPDSITLGAANTRISGPRGSIASAIQGDHLLGTIVLDGNRSTHFPFDRTVDTLPIVFTFTMPQHAPKIDTAYISMPQTPTVTFRNVTVMDTAVDFTLENLCADTLLDVTVQLLCNDTTLAVFDCTPEVADTLMPHAEVPMHIGMSVLKWERSWSGLLHAYSTTTFVDCDELHLHGRLDGIAPSLSFALFDTDTVGAPHIQPTTEYLLLTAVDGIYDTLSVSLTALPSDTRITTLHSPLFTRFTTPDTISQLHLEGFVARGNFRQDYNLWMTAGSREDGFEESLSCYPWDVSSLRPWIVDSTEHHSGSFSMRSAPIAGRQTSDLGLDIMVSTPDSIAFWAHTSSEHNYDKLVFSIDGVKKMELSGNAGWRRCTYPLEAGSHRLLWRYVKDDSGNSGSDCAWIDDVELPLALWDAAYGCFCSTEPMAIETFEAEESMSVSPTVTVDVVWIAAQRETEAVLTDMLGRHITTLHLAAGTPYRLSLRHLPAGVYLIKAANGTVKKIIKQ